MPNADQEPLERRRRLRRELTNIPNLLTFGRIAMIPPVMWLMLQQTPVANFFAAIIFTLAAVTDWADGYLARRMGLESLLGKLLDPLADKLIVLATLVVAVELGHIPGWFVVLLLARELTITGLRSLASQQGFVIDVVRAGKFKTAFQLIGLVAIIVHHPYVIDFGVATEVINFNLLGIALLSIALLFSLASAAVYFKRFVAAIIAA